MSFVVRPAHITRTAFQEHVTDFPTQRSHSELVEDRSFLDVACWTVAGQEKRFRQVETVAASILFGFVSDKLGREGICGAQPLRRRGW